MDQFASDLFRTDLYRLTVSVRFHMAVEGGRSTPVASDFRPDCWFGLKQRDGERLLHGCVFFFRRGGDAYATKTMMTLQGTNLAQQRIIAPHLYLWFYDHQLPLPGSHVWLCRYTGRERWPMTAHQYGMTAALPGSPSPVEGDPINAFGVVFAIGEVAFWLVGYDLPGPPPTRGSSDGAHLLLWPATGPDVHWPPRTAFATDADLEALARRTPAGVEAQGRAFGADESARS